MIPSAQIRRAMAWVLLVALVGLAVSLELTHAKQIQASHNLQSAQQRQQRLAELSGAFVQTELAGRGALLERSTEALQSYQSARARLRTALQSDLAPMTITPTSASSETQTNLSELRASISTRLMQLDDALAQPRGAGDGVASAAAAASASTTDRITASIAALSARERGLATVATARGERVQGITRSLLAALLLVSVVLLIGVALPRTRLTREDAPAGTGAARAEGAVSRATDDLAALSRRVQHLIERDKAQLARSLHDELGGLLIAVKMDTSWLQKRWPHPTPEVQARWERVFKVLDDGVDFKRRVVEHLRPTLLDNMGLIAALRWVTQETCARADLSCSEIYPEREPLLSEDVSILVFRLVQEALSNVVQHARARQVRVELSEAAEHITVTVADDGVGIGGATAPSAALHGLALMDLRVRSHGGSLAVESAPGGGTVLRARLPAQRRPEESASSTEQPASDQRRRATAM